MLAVFAAILTGGALLAMTTALLVLGSPLSTVATAALASASVLSFAIVTAGACGLVRRFVVVTGGGEDHGGGGGGSDGPDRTGPRPPTDEPDWWPQFEGELRAYLEAHERLPIAG